MYIRLNSKADCLHAPFKKKWDSIWTNDLNFTFSFSPPLHNYINWVTIKVLSQNQLVSNCRRGRSGWAKIIQRFTFFQNICRKVAGSFSRIEMKTIGTGFKPRGPLFTNCVHFAIVPETNVSFPLGRTGHITWGLASKRNVIKHLFIYQENSIYFHPCPKSRGYEIEKNKERKISNHCKNINAQSAKRTMLF